MGCGFPADLVTGYILPCSAERMWRSRVARRSRFMSLQRARHGASVQSAARIYSTDLIRPANTEFRRGCLKTWRLQGLDMDM